MKLTPPAALIALFFTQAARADNSAPRSVSVDGADVRAESLAVRLADNTRFAVTRACPDAQRCPATALISVAAGDFARMQPLELPFSAYDLNVMTLRIAGVVLRYGEGHFMVERNAKPIAALDLPERRTLCTGPWIRSLFLHEKSRTLLIEFEYHDRADCVASAPIWRALRFPPG